ncbi:MAG: hypothetical protein ACOH2L_13065 [Devosia sp.]
MLNGQTVLIVEEEFLIALDIQRMLETLSAGPTLFARSLSEAHGHQEQWHAVDLAIVELGEAGAPTNALLQGLRAAGITLVLSTTDTMMQQGHPEFPGAPVIVKPMMEEDFRQAIAKALTQRA